MGKSAFNVTEADAMDYVAGYALALDMTAKEVLVQNFRHHKKVLPAN